VARWRNATCEGHRLFDRQCVDFRNNPFAVAADNDEVEEVASAKIPLLVRHVRGEIDKVSRANLSSIFEPFSPTNFTVALNNIDGHFVTFVVMRTSLHVRL
jgi:hypothetical protein